jgi:Intracellular proteinase inhibitor
MAQRLRRRIVNTLMNALIVRRGAAVLLLAVGVAVALPVASGRQDATNGLKYKLRMSPGNLQVDRMPGPGPAKSYEENFTFVVANSGKTEYNGTAPSCKTYDIAVAPVDKPDQPVWQWSHGQMFCMMVTSVTIPPGERWAKYDVWKFTAAEVPDGKYRATVTFIPEKKTASVEFEVTSVH